MHGVEGCLGTLSPGVPLELGCWFLSLRQSIFCPFGRYPPCGPMVRTVVNYVVVQRKCPPKCSGKVSVGMVLSY